MTRRIRLAVFLIGATGVAVLFGAAFGAMPAIGDSVHPYRDLAVAAATAHHTANVVSSINFDQRPIDTFGEESILLGSVLATAALLRPMLQESAGDPPPAGRTLESTRLLGVILMPITLILGLDVIAHGQVTPGGGFQGGVVLASGIHLLYVTGRFDSLRRLRPMGPFDIADALGAAGFGLVGFTGMLASGQFLANLLPQGAFGQLLSGGTVPVLNVLVGLEVTGGIVVLLSKFLDQEITVHAAPPQDES